MANITWETIVHLLGDAFNDRNDKTKWSAVIKEIETGKEVKVPVTAVSCEALTGLKLTLDRPDLAPTILSAKPGSLSRTKIYVDGAYDPEAALIFQYKGGPFNLSRWAFDIRPVTIEGKEYRVDIRFDP